MDRIKIVSEIKKGWSSDKKFRVTDGGSEYFLRIYPDGDYCRHRSEFELMKACERAGVPMAKAVEYGECPEGLYLLEEYIDGVDGEEYVKGLSDIEAYRTGIEAGRALKLIHTVPAPKDALPWGKRFSNKLDRKIKMYDECPLRYENGGLFLDFIAENRRLITDRPQTMHHGDYHVGNMMFVNGSLRVIDFNRDDCGDPWEEFNRIVWSAQCSGAFASGCVDGYFDESVPEEFWRLLALYIASNTLSSLPWAIPFGEGEIRTMRNQAKEILGWYDEMRRIVPRWYRKNLLKTPIDSTLKQ